jgi:competence protein ComEC
MRYAAGLAMTSIVAGAATATFAAYHFHRIAPLGLPANLAALPVFSTMVMPPAVMAMVLMPFDLEAPALHVMGFGISLVTEIAEWFARHTAGDVIGLVPPQAVVSMTVALVILVIATTKWRLAAIPFMIAGIIFVSQRRIPDIMVSEDAGLVAVRTAKGTLAVNRSRPNDFTMGDWEKASVTEGWTKPEKIDRIGEQLSTDRFACSGGLCLIIARHNVQIAYVSDQTRIKDACTGGEVVIVADPTIKQPCSGTGKTVLTAKTLALYGTTFVYIANPGGAYAQAPPGSIARPVGTGPPQPPKNQEISVEQAIRSVDRPWHHDRVYLRHARGLRELD